MECDMRDTVTVPGLGHTVGLDRLLHSLPRGRELTNEAWQERHHGIVIRLWLHTVGIPVFGSWQETGLATAALPGC